MRIRIRLENSSSREERDSIRGVNTRAFGGTEEADLVDALRGSEYELLSLVAESDRGLAGHILFSRMWIETAQGKVAAVALAPVAVVPERQRQGVGRALIWRGLELLRERGERIVIVVGHPPYYPQFGFSTEKAARLDAPFPREAFMALELAPGALEGIGGRVIYPPAFGL